MTNQKLLERQQTLQFHIDKLQKNSSEFELEKTKEIYMISNDIECRKSQFELLQGDKFELQKKVEIVSTEARTKSMEVGQLFMSINNMYETCQIERPYIQRRIVNWNKYAKNYNSINERSNILFRKNSRTAVS